MPVYTLMENYVFFWLLVLVQTLAGWQSLRPWQSPLTTQYSGEFSESGISAVQCYDCLGAQSGSGHDTQVGRAKSETRHTSHPSSGRQSQSTSVHQRQTGMRAGPCPPWQCCVSDTIVGECLSDQRDLGRGRMQLRIRPRGVLACVGTPPIPGSPPTNFTLLATWLARDAWLLLGHLFVPHAEETPRTATVTPCSENWERGARQVCTSKTYTNAWPHRGQGLAEAR